MTAETRAWNAATFGGQPPEIIVAAYDRMQTAERRRTIGWATMGVGLAGAAGTTTWIMLSGDKDGAALAVNGTF